MKELGKWLAMANITIQRCFKKSVLADGRSTRGAGRKTYKMNKVGGRRFGKAHIELEKHSRR
jgi:hypothetical protein